MKPPQVVSLLTAVGILAAGVAFWAPPVEADPTPPAEVDFGRVKAKFTGDVPLTLADWALARGGTVVLTDNRIDLAAIQLNDGVNGDWFLSELRSRADVVWATYDGIARVSLTPNDPYWGSQYGPQLIEADVAWNTVTGSSDIIVAIIDTGVEQTHPDLRGPCTPHCAQAGYDAFGHGTHVAGTVAATMNNGIGVAGVAQVKLMAVKGLSDAGAAWWSQIAVAILDAAAVADVLSMSLGGNCFWGSVHLCPDVEEAIDVAWSLNRVLVAASGNDGLNNFVSHPAAFNHVVAVGSVGPTKARSWFSNGGAELDLVAPGEDVLSTVSTVNLMCNLIALNQPYCYASGTSMATPHVSGVAGLVWSKCPWLSNAQVVSILTSTAEPLGGGGWNAAFGHGLVRADSAVAAC